MLNRNVITLSLWTSCLILLGASGLAAEAVRPNIVFILVDDLGYADCGFNGGNEIKTPNIDQLAASGTVIESHYVQPVCSPTRAALMTGRYATRTGVYTIVRPHAKWGLPLNERTLATALKEAGYETAITGKWHLGEFERAYLPTARGFDHQYGHYFGALDYFTHIRDGSHDWYRNDQEVKEEGYSTHLLTQEACRLISHRNPQKPLFLYVPFNGVHSPFQCPEEYLRPYANLKGNRRLLAGMLSAVDEAIGKIVQALDAAGIRDNTLIIFSSDNGGPRPGENTPLRDYKGTIYEGGVRAAAFAHWPGKIPSAVRLKQPMHIIDWYPTLLELAGGSLNQPNPLDGRNVWPMLTLGAASPHDAILCVQSPQKAAVRMGDWKLIMNGDRANNPAANQRPRARATGSEQAATFALYNLAVDPSEANNVADQQPDRLASMRERLTSLLEGAVPPGNGSVE